MAEQRESFECPLTIPALADPSKPFNAIFIRAPAVHSFTAHPSAEPIEVIASIPSECVPAPPPADSPLGPANVEDMAKVMLRSGRKLVTSFHPELSGDDRIHRYWVEHCVLPKSV